VFYYHFYSKTSTFCSKTAILWQTLFFCIYKWPTATKTVQVYNNTSKHIYYYILLNSSTRMLLNCHFIYRITKKSPFFQRFRIAKNISALKLNCYLCDALDIQNNSIGTSTDICLSGIPLIFFIYLFIIYDGILLTHECSSIYVSIVCIFHDHVIR